MKNSLYMGLGVATGVAIYEFAVHGLSGADWYKAVFVGIFCTLVFVIFRLFKAQTSK